MEGEKWDLRFGGAIGSDWVPCFITGAPKRLRSNITGFAESREAGERLVMLFGGPQYAHLDFRAHEPDWVQVKVGVDPEYVGALFRLAQLVTANKGFVTPGIVQQVRKESPAKPAFKPAAPIEKNKGPK